MAAQNSDMASYQIFFRRSETEVREHPQLIDAESCQEALDLAAREARPGDCEVEALRIVTVDNPASMPQPSQSCRRGL